MEKVFIDVFRTAALQAGAVARRLQGQVPLRNKLGGTPESAALTAVDLATQDVILLALRERMPDVAVDAEEDTESVRLFAPAGGGRPLVVIDPVDGTLNYARGESEYAVMGSLVRDGVVTAAVVYFPEWGEVYTAARGAGCWRQRDREDGRAPEPVAVSDGGSRVLVGPNAPKTLHAALSAEGFDVHVSRCSAVDSSAPATGRASAALSLGRADRRRALALLCTTEAGGVVRCGGRNWAGEDAEGGLEAPCIVAASADLAQRIEHLLERWSRRRPWRRS